MARQMNLVPGAGIMAEDDPVALAALAVTLHEDPAVWTSVRDTAQDRVQWHHSAGRFRASLTDILETTAEASGIQDF
jgi:hypothetical protein